VTAPTVTGQHICWHDTTNPCRKFHEGAVPLAYGRCRSGRRWFWAARDWENGSAHGWDDDEQGALAAARAAVVDLAAGCPAVAYRRESVASSVLKEVNAVKRAVRPPSTETGADAVEYLFGAYWSSWIDDMTGDYCRRVVPFQVTRKTAKRIYYIRRNHGPGDVETGYIDRQEFEADTRCPGGTTAAGRPERCNHGYYAGHEHGEGAGEIRTRRHWEDDGHLFATREAAGEYLFGAERERECQEPELKRLRREMADAHPDRGGTDAGFIAARKRYERALRRAS
jgi:hypothetical protein